MPGWNPLAGNPNQATVYEDTGTNVDDYTQNTVTPGGKNVNPHTSKHLALFLVLAVGFVVILGRNGFRGLDAG